MHLRQLTALDGFQCLRSPTAAPAVDDDADTTAAGLEGAARPGTPAGMSVSGWTLSRPPCRPCTHTVCP